MSINFYLNNDTRSKKTEKSIFVYVRGLQKYKTIVVNSKLRIDPKYWNPERQRAKKGAPNEVQLNRYLDKFKAKVTEVVQELLIDDNEYTFEQVREIVKKAFELKVSDDFMEVLDVFIDSRKSTFENNTIKKYITVKNHLLKFQEDRNFKITFENLDINFFDKFYDYCINHLEIMNNTIRKDVSILKTFISWCNERGITKVNETKKFEVKGYSTDIVTLTDNELKLIEDYTPSLPHLSNVKDVFLLSTYTGQRFSDIHNLRYSDIDLKKKIWNLRTKKTKDIIKVPLSNKAISIIDKYKDEDKFIPTISNQKYNEYIKRLCKEAEINEPVTITSYRGSRRIDVTKPKYELITSHTARRTFVTLSLIKGMQPHILMKITGHKDYKTLNKYVRIDVKSTQNELEKIWN